MSRKNITRFRLDPKIPPRLSKAEVDRLEKAVEDNWKGLSKNVEIRLRRQLMMMENYAMSASYSERPAAEAVSKRLSAIHDRVLNRIMKPHK